MSNDMLGPLVRASVGLSKARLSLALDLVNKLKGGNAQDWEFHLKNVLRDGAPAFEKFALKPTCQGIELAHAMGFDPQAAYQQCQDLIFFAEGFWDRVLSKTHPQSFGPWTGLSFDLAANGNENMILAKLKRQGYLFPNESTLCLRILQLIKRQPHGDDGDLIVEGCYPNIFFLTTCVVIVSWEESQGKWRIATLPRRTTTWLKNTRVFSYA